MLLKLHNSYQFLESEQDVVDSGLLSGKYRNQYEEFRLRLLGYGVLKTEAVTDQSL